MGQQHTYSCAVSHPYYALSIKYRVWGINTFRPYQVLPGLPEPLLMFATTVSVVSSVEATLVAF